MSKTPVNRGTIASAVVEPAPFGPDLQGTLIKILVEDPEFSGAIIDYIKPNFFQNPAHAWAWSFATEYRTKYGALPTLNLILDQAGRLDPSTAPIFQASIAQARESVDVEHVFVKDQVLEWVRKSVFMGAFYDVRDLWNNGKRVEAYDSMREAMTVVDHIGWEDVDRGWYNREEFVGRLLRRQSGEVGRPIGTGIPDLDTILEGGVMPGFLGVWIAYPKVGKTTWLTNQGAISIRAYMAKTLHVVLEGSRYQVESRYDAIFVQDLYASIKAGEIDSAKYAMAMRELDSLRNLLVVRGFTDNWDTNILHIDNEIRDLKQNYGWDPEMVIIDYADLMRGRPKPGGYKSETDEQVNAYKDVKRLANRGYRIWTAAQARRPKNDDWQSKEENITSKDVADAYGKIRICDFIGSLNQTVAERQRKEMRMYAELYRDNAAEKSIRVRTDFDTMTFSEAPQSGSSYSHPATNTTSAQGALAYGKPNLAQKRSQ